MNRTTNHDPRAPSIRVARAEPLTAADVTAADVTAGDVTAPDVADPLTRFERFAAAEVAAANRSLHLLMAGCFGVCRACHGPIEVERLETLPETQWCAACASAAAAERRAALRVVAGTGKGEKP